MTDSTGLNLTLVSFPLAVMDYFGKNGRDTSSFMQELKALSPEDKAELRLMLRDVGYNLPSVIVER